MQEEIEQKSFNIMISTTKLSARTVLRAVKAAFRLYQSKASQGKQSVRTLLRQNRGVSSVEISKTGIRGLERYGRMIEIYCMVSLAPIPMATWGNHEQSHMGQNYLKCLFALGFQGFLILICVAIYAVLIQSVAISGDAINSIWSIVGYTVLLCFSLFKTSSVTKSVLGAH